MEVISTYHCYEVLALTQKYSIGIFILKLHNIVFASLSQRSGEIFIAINQSSWKSLSNFNVSREPPTKLLTGYIWGKLKDVESLILMIRILFPKKISFYSRSLLLLKKYSMLLDTL
jgi:hypothetical protein